MGLRRGTVWEVPAGYRWSAAFVLGAVLTTLAPPLHAADPLAVAPSSAAPAAPASSMPIDLPVDLAITLGGMAFYVATELSTPALAPSSCRWCDRAADGTDQLNSFDASVRRAWRWTDSGKADTLSSVFSFGLAPLAGFGVGALVAWHDDRLNELAADTLVVAESAVVAVNVNQISKFVFARQRPDVHARVSTEPNVQPATGDNLSFFSGHATLAFALATSAGTVASMRHHRLAPVMWAAGLLLATTGSYLRIAADRHYATDVMTGAVVGSAIGFSVPYFAHRPVAPNTGLAVVPSEGAATLVLWGTW
jgi:membrane-associated phospholipid phosphatase